MIRALPCSTSGTGATTSGTFWWWMRDALSPTRKSRSRTPSWRSRIAPAIIWRKSFDWATCRDVPLERLSAGTSRWRETARRTARRRPSGASLQENDPKVHGLFKDKFRIPSARLPKWDYTRAAAYFVTLCTKGSVHSFGDVVEGEMILSPMGRIVAEEWQKTPRLRLNVELDQWQIMPNHLHG